MSEMVYGWKNCAAIAGIPVRTLRDLASERNLVEGHRADGAIGISRDVLESLAVEFRKGAAVGTVEPRIDVVVDGPPCKSTADGSAAKTPEPSPITEFVTTDPAPPKPYAHDPAPSVSDLAVHLARLSESVDSLAMRIRKDEDRMIGLDIVLAESFGEMEGLRRQISRLEQARAMDRTGETLAAMRHQIDDLQQWRGAMEQRIATIEGLVNAIPKALVPTGVTCPRCLQSTMVSATGCACCGVGMAAS
jgi:hypothetical protein